MCKRLIQHGADVNAVNSNGMQLCVHLYIFFVGDTALHGAMRVGDFRMILYLVSNWADLNKKNHGKAIFCRFYTIYRARDTN